MTTQRVVFLDVDGTILEHGVRIASSTPEAIRAARARGHLVVLCTGRSEADLPEPVRDIPVDGAITNGGAFARFRGEQVLSLVMARDDVESLLVFFLDEHLEFLLQSHEAVFASPGARAMVLGEELGRADDRGGAHPAAFPGHRPIADADLGTIAKAVFLGAERTVLSRAQEALGGRFQVIPGSMPLPGGSHGEIAMRGVHKGAAIRRVLDIAGIDVRRSVGIGDSWNDVEMFDLVGTSVAMGDADPALRVRADMVTTSVLDDGVRNAFVRLGLL